MQSDFLLSEAQLARFMQNGAMNHQYGIQLYFELDRQKAQALLPPPLQLTELALGYLYIVNIREPTFAPWYMEGGLGILAEYNGTVGVHFLGLQLSGPGAVTGMCTGREGSGLPKKLADRIRVERQGDTGHCLIERGGVRLADVTLQMGHYNDPLAQSICAAQEGCSPANPITTEGGCLLFRYDLNVGGTSGPLAQNLRLTHYDSPTRFYTWEPATAQATFCSSADDAWGALPVTHVLGGGWMVSDNWVRGQQVLHRYPDGEGNEMMRYLFSGRYDRCALCDAHQSYE